MSEGASRIVVDSTVAVKWFVSDREDAVAEALELRADHIAGTRVLAAPSHIVFEVLNALRFRGLDAAGMQDAANRLLGVRLELAPVESLAFGAAQIAVEHDLTVYDAAFVALAASLDAELVTADRVVAACPACRTRLIGG